MHNGKYIFHNEEDKRITRAVFRVVKENLADKMFIVKWLEELGECKCQNSRKQYIARVNSKNFIRCLYFQLIYYDNSLDIINTIIKVEEKLNRFPKKE